ncbi:MAG: hypothetical protein J0M30_14785 [Chitinophagales bacterium]|nr:hypothetical protein [Chitinophagales bacterium]
MAAIVTIEDMKTHLYSEIMTTISRNDNTILQAGIDTAISEAMGYCSRYDIAVLFDKAQNGPDRAKLIAAVKDLAAWEICKLANPTVNLELFEALQEKALEWLLNVQTGKVVPYGWPYPADDEATNYNENNSIQYTGNTKRSNHY